jgi:hypothetical protein
MQRPSQRRFGLSGLTLWQVATLWFVSLSAQAQFPTPVNPTSGAPNGNYLALAISGAGFLWVGWILLSKFNEARSSNDPDWGFVGLTAVIGEHHKVWGIIAKKLRRHCEILFGLRYVLTFLHARVPLFKLRA